MNINRLITLNIPEYGILDINFNKLMILEYYGILKLDEENTIIKTYDELFYLIPSKDEKKYAAIITPKSLN